MVKRPMKWLTLAFVLLCPGGIAVYAFGCWLLGKWPWEMWHEQVPLMYDGKEPFDVWQQKMERARQLQRLEEADSD